MEYINSSVLSRMKVQWRSGSAPFLYSPERVNMSKYLSDADVVGSTPTWTILFILLPMCLTLSSIFEEMQERELERNKFYQGALNKVCPFFVVTISNDVFYIN